MTKTTSRIISKRHLKSQDIGDIKEGILTRIKFKNDEHTHIAEYFFLISDFEPKTITEALTHDFWLNTMQDEIN